MLGSPRTRETWELIAPELAAPRGTFDQRAYDAGPGPCSTWPASCPPGGRTALFVGHNPARSPTWPTPWPRPPKGRHLHFPTAAFAVLEFTGDWADLAPGHARLAAFTAPACD